MSSRLAVFFRVPGASIGPAAACEARGPAECAASRQVVAQAPSLDVLSKQASERTGQPWSLRWIVTHMIEEYARHNGHADLLRERVDGSTGYY